METKFIFCATFLITLCAFCSQLAQLNTFVLKNNAQSQLFCLSALPVNTVCVGQTANRTHQKENKEKRLHLQESFNH